MMDKALMGIGDILNIRGLGLGNYPNVGPNLTISLILGPKFWECSNQGFYPTLFNPGYVKFGLDNLDLVLALGVCYVL
jgi:hypothetical protein